MGNKVEHTHVPWPKWDEWQPLLQLLQDLLLRCSLLTFIFIHFPLRLYMMQDLFINYTGSDQTATRRKKFHRMTLTPTAPTSTFSGRASLTSIHQVPLLGWENMDKTQTILCLVLPLVPYFYTSCPTLLLLLPAAAWFLSVLFFCSSSFSRRALMFYQEQIVTCA